MVHVVIVICIDGLAKHTSARCFYKYRDRDGRVDGRKVRSLLESIRSFG